MDGLNALSGKGNKVNVNKKEGSLSTVILSLSSSLSLFMIFSLYKFMFFSLSLYKM
jgi:hypothetical protein